jgi:hypothetical protein
VKRPSLKTRHYAENNPEARVWLKLGLKPQAARGLIKAGIFKIQQLEGMSREDFLSIRGLSLRSLRLCEKALGRTLPSIVEYWKKTGIPKMAIAVLYREGINTIEQLKAMSRAEVLALRGVGLILVQRMEKSLGFRFASPVSYWLDKGLPKKTAETLVREGILTIEQLAAMDQATAVRVFNPLEFRMLGIVLRRETSHGNV